MSRLSGSIHTLRAGLVEAINAAGLPPCIVGMVLEQVRGQVAVLERHPLCKGSCAALWDPG